MRMGENRYDGTAGVTLSTTGTKHTATLVGPARIHGVRIGVQTALVNPSAVVMRLVITPPTGGGSVITQDFTFTKSIGIGGVYVATCSQPENIYIAGTTAVVSLPSADWTSGTGSVSVEIQDLGAQSAAAAGSEREEAIGVLA